MSTSEVHDWPQPADRALSRREQDGSVPEPAAVDPTAVRRGWDLRPGQSFHGRTIASVHGVVGLASSPVAVITFTGQDAEHPLRARIGATHTDTDRGHDELRLLARAWVRARGLQEGQAVDLARLRADVLAAVVHG